MPAEPTKPMTVRVPEGLALELEMIARVAGVSVSQEILTGIMLQIDARRADKGFQAQLRRRLEIEQKAARRLAGHDANSD